MYVDKLDFSKVKFGDAGPPRPVKFTVAAWSNEQVKAVLAADRNTDLSYGKLQASFLSFFDAICVFSSFSIHYSHIRFSAFCLLQLMAKYSIDYNFFGGTHSFFKWMDVHANPSCSLQVL